MEAAALASEPTWRREGLGASQGDAVLPACHPFPGWCPVPETRGKEGRRRGLWKGQEGYFKIEPCRSISAAIWIFVQLYLSCFFPTEMSGTTEDMPWPVDPDAPGCAARGLRVSASHTLSRRLWPLLCCLWAM